MQSGESGRVANKCDQKKAYESRGANEKTEKETRRWKKKVMRAGIDRNQTL